MRVTRCLYGDFFRRHDAPELTELYCAWDLNWASEVSPAKHGMRFERPSTLAAGKNSCDFVFVRTLRN